MMKDMIVNISKETSMVSCFKKIIGNDGENLQGNIIFKFEDEFVDGIARLEYKIKNDKKYIMLNKIDETYTIPIKSVLTVEGQIDMQLVITEKEKDEGIPIFKSNVFYVYCNKSINAEIEGEEKYLQWIEIANQKIIEIDEAIKKAEGVQKIPYTYLKQIKDYLYEIQFDYTPAISNVELNNIGGCSTYSIGNKVYRNLDYNYNENTSFLVKTPNYKGMAFVDGIYNEDMGNWDLKKISQLPNLLVDGINKNGVFVSTHIIFNDFEITSYSGEDGIYMYQVPSLILNNCKTLEEVQNFVNSIKDKLVIPEFLGEYISIYFIRVENKCYVLQPNESEYELKSLENMAIPKLTNFLNYGADIVNKHDSQMQLRPTGIERYNQINENTKLEDLRFTICYEESTRLSEFIGIDETTKNSEDSELIAIYNKAKSIYEKRTRNGETWQTVHSVIYNLDDYDMSVYVQEDYSQSYNEGLNVFTYRQLHTTIDGNEAYIRDEKGKILTFKEVVDLYLDPNVFVYCLSANVVHIPAFNEPNAMAFMGSYNIGGLTHLSRVIINSENDVNLIDIEVEDAGNKSKRIDARSTDEQYPTSKAVYNKLHTINDDLTTKQQDIDNLELEVENLTNNVNIIANDIDTHTNEINELENDLDNAIVDIIDLEGSLNHIDDIKADKETTYTKQQIDEIIGTIENVRIEMVENLPEAGETNKIYFVHRPDANSNDTYNEYIWENDKYELIGNTQIDLSNYYSKEDIDSKGFATTSSLIAGINSCEPKLANTVDYSFQEIMYGNGESGYRKYKNGMIEQWGVATTNASETEFTMHQTHIDQKFSIFIEPREQGNFYHYAIPSANQKFKCRIQSRDSVSMAVKFQWRSFGRWK